MVALRNWWVLILVLSTVMVVGCCKDKKGTEPHWNSVMTHLFFLQKNVTRASDAEPKSDVTFLSWGSELYLRESGILKTSPSASEALTLWFQNEGEQSVTFHWNEIRYVDEYGHEHEVFHYPFGVYETTSVVPVSATGSTIVAPGEGIWETFRPVEKTYLVYWGRFCGNQNFYSESLVPWDFEGRDAANMRSYVLEMSRRETPVRWRIPITFGEERQVYEIEWIVINLERFFEVQDAKESYLNTHGQPPDWVRTGAPKGWIKNTTGE